MPASLVVIGASRGGTRALEALRGALPADLPLPIVVVQHRHRDGDDALGETLRRSSALPVVEPDDKEPLSSGRIYLAPADYHLLVEPGALALSTDAPVAFSRPSSDVLFESAAATYGPGAVGVILTGANADGAAGARRVAERGGRVIVQDPAEAEAPAMPRAAIAAAGASEVRILPLAAIAAELARLGRKEAG
jgi:two-component system chemotaxis response regulator CheB